MKLRTKLIFAFVLLALAPLATIVSYSYATSQHTFKARARSEAQGLAQDLVDQHSARRDELEGGLESIAELDLLGLRSGDSDVAAIYLALMEVVATFEEDVESFDLRLDKADSSTSPSQALEVGFQIFPSRALARALAKVDRLRDKGVVAPEEYAEQTRVMVAQVVRDHEAIDLEDSEVMEHAIPEAQTVFGRDLGAEIEFSDDRSGRLGVRVDARDLVHQLLSESPRSHGEIPFALDLEGDLYFGNAADRKATEDAGLLLGQTAGGDWIVERAQEPISGLEFGVARPIREALEMERATAFRSFSAGLLLVGIAGLGISWIASRLTRNLILLTAGAERVGAGDLTARVPIRSKDELGLLASTFNRMAESLSEHNRRLYLEEKRRQEQEVEQRLLELENQRKTQELEEAREIQLSLLPKQIPRSESWQIALSMETATEVGGDYYDFHEISEDGLVAAIGDATGHGARAGTMVAFIKGLFAAGASILLPAEFLDQATRSVRRLELHRLHMALTLVHVQEGVLRLSSAGMPPAYLARRNGEIRDLTMQSMPLGGLTHFPYPELRLEVESGDCLLLLTDGLPELERDDGEIFGYPRTRELFAGLVDRRPDEIVSALENHAAQWRGDQPLPDDMTFIVIRFT